MRRSETQFTSDRSRAKTLHVFVQSGLLAMLMFFSKSPTDKEGKMKEPFMIAPDGSRVPYSQIPTIILLHHDEVPRMYPHERDPEVGDADFNRRYAAILLRERGQ
jgi:hypothetical protein